MKIKNCSKEEERVNSISHIFGIILSIVGLVFLIIKSLKEGSTIDIVAYTIYGSTLILLYFSSSIYHGLPSGKAKRFFKKMDHIAIYLLIVGTYTPFCLSVFSNKLGIVLISIQLFLAICGVVFKAIWVDRFVILSTSIYLVMGWMIVFAIKPLSILLSPYSMLLLVIGGLSYTIGVIFYIFPMFKYHHAVWHIFVLIGSFTHCVTVLSIEL